MSSNKATIQNEQYSFPYHYLPRLLGGDNISLHRQLSWGLDYLTYMTFLSEKISELKPNALLDVGCGDGRFYSFVKDNVRTFKGVDLSSEAINWAKCFNPGVDFEACDCKELTGKYDIVSLIEVLEHIPDSEVESFVSNIQNLVKPNGYFVLSVPSVNIPVNWKHYRHYDEKLLTSHIGQRFEVVSTFWVYKQGLTEWLLRHCLINRYFTLNHRWSRKMIWKLHKKSSYMADENSGTHIVCFAKPKAF